jgi:hypothetical protein
MQVVPRVRAGGNGKFDSAALGAGRIPDRIIGNSVPGREVTGIRTGCPAG